MKIRRLTLLAAAAAVTAGLTACGATTTDAAKTPAPATSTAGTPSAAATASATKSTAAAKPAITRNVAVKKKNGCPVTEETLLAALAAKGKKHADASLSTIVCHTDGWAIAEHEVPGHDQEVQVYRYDDGAWRYFTGGSGAYCVGVPLKVQKHFAAQGRPCDTASHPDFNG